MYYIIESEGESKLERTITSLLVTTNNNYYKAHTLSMTLFVRLKQVTH